MTTLKTIIRRMFCCHNFIFRKEIDSCVILGLLYVVSEQECDKCGKKIIRRSYYNVK